MLTIDFYGETQIEKMRAKIGFFKPKSYAKIRYPLRKLRIRQEDDWEWAR